MSTTFNKLGTQPPQRENRAAATGTLPSRGPDMESLPRYPVSWYRFAASEEITTRPLSRRMLGRLLVAYRGEGGVAAVLDGRCAHMGAELGQGRVVGDALRCPFHGWEYDARGLCTRIPACGDIPGFARVRSYPVVERHGSLFFYSGSTPPVDLPFFRDADPAEFIAAKPLVIEYDAPWFMVVGNAFDVQHFRVVHDRMLLDEPVSDQPHPFARRIRYRAKVVGKSLGDRITRRLAGDEVAVEQTVWFGNLLTTHARFTRGESFIYFAVEPREDGGTHLEAIVMCRRSAQPSIAGGLTQQASLAVRRWLTSRFLTHENATLRSLRYSPGSLIEADREMLRYLHWVSSLPRD